MRNAEHDGRTDLKIKAVLENWPTTGVAAGKLTPQLARDLRGLRVDEEAEVAHKKLTPYGLRARSQLIDVVLVDVAQEL
jgi:hypothetical protein